MIAAVALTDQVFGETSFRAPVQMELLYLTITQLDNEDMLRALQASGQGSAFGDLRNFLTEVRFLTQMPDRADIRLDARMRADLDKARRVVATACTPPEPEGGDGPAPESDEPGKSGTKTLTALAERITQTARRALSGDQQAYLQDNFKLELLLRLLAGIALAAALAAAAHYGFVVFKVVRRNRRTCRIPARLDCMMTPLDCQVIVLGRLGCVAELSGPDRADMPELSSGTYCTLSVADQTISAKLTRRLKRGQGMLFAQPLAPEVMRRMLAQSLEPTRLDFSVVTGSEGQRSAFGSGSLLTPTRRR